MSYFLGLDLGQAADYSGIAILEKLWPDGRPEAEPFAILKVSENTSPRPRRAPGPAPAAACVPSFHCRYLERLPLGTPYPAVVRHVAGLLERPELRGCTQLVVDATGVGRPVVDLLTQERLSPVPVTITGGDQVSYERGWRVPKRDLVGAVSVLLQTERLKFADAIPAVPTLVQELMAFRVKIDPLTAHDSYGAWREGSHDDLVLAVAVAAWWGLRWTGPDPARQPSSRSYASL
ncbi:MAG: hypothetical protein ABIY46_05050 [Gemmatimonadales bacterium]